MSFTHHADLAERLLQGVDVTYDAIEVIKKNPNGEDIVVSHHALGEGGTLRDTYPHFMNMIGGLMLEPAIKAGFRMPVSHFKLGDISQYAEHFEKQANTGYVVKVKNLKMTVPQIETAQDTVKEMYKAGLDWTAAMWGGENNPWAQAGASFQKYLIDSHSETFDASRTIKEGEYDLSEFAAEMAQWAGGVNQWLELMGAAQGKGRG